MNLQFDFTIVEPPDGSYGSMKDDGSWDGMIKMLIDDVSRILKYSSLPTTRKGNVFTGVCLGGGRVCLLCGGEGGLLGGSASWRLPIVTSSDGHCSGWYTSYWNVFLFTLQISHKWVPIIQQGPNHTYCKFLPHPKKTISGEKKCFLVKLAPLKSANALFKIVQTEISFPQTRLCFTLLKSNFCDQNLHLNHQQTTLS